MTLILKILLIVGAIVALIIIFIVGSTYYWFATKQIRRELARNVLISTDWLEFTPQPPLRVKYDEQHVYLSIEGYKYKVGDPFTPIKLPDGMKVDPEIQVLDEHGQVHNLSNQKGRTVVGSSVGFSAHFPRDRVYTKVKIRSEQSFLCSKVYWECSRRK